MYALINFVKENFGIGDSARSSTGYDEFRVECHSFKMPLNYYYIEKVIPHLPRPNIGLIYHIGNHLYRNSRVSCVRGMRRMTYKESWINAAKTCKRKGMSLPDFLSRRGQEELLYLLKSTSIFPVKALLIGLYGSSGQVCCNHVTDYSYQFQNSGQ